jgi:hypothetical protein
MNVDQRNFLIMDRADHLSALVCIVAFQTVSFRFVCRSSRLSLANETVRFGKRTRLSEGTDHADHV